jgi:hypothetical protein
MKKKVKEFLSYTSGILGALSAGVGLANSIRDFITGLTHKAAPVEAPAPAPFPGPVPPPAPPGITGGAEQGLFEMINYYVSPSILIGGGLLLLILAILFRYYFLKKTNNGGAE